VAEAADNYNEGLKLLSAQSTSEALAAFTRAASIGHPAAHAAAAALYFEGGVERDGKVVDGDFVKAYDMCVTASWRRSYLSAAGATRASRASRQLI
jgi:TPR repeat protein